MNQAITHKLQHPEDSYTVTAKRFKVPATTLHDRMNDTHAPRGQRTRRNLSIPQEVALLNNINAYAGRGTLLTPHHITQLAQALCDRTLGKNWTSTFLRRHKDQVSSRFYRVQEVARIKADTPSNRAAFLDLVCRLSHTDMPILTASGQRCALNKPIHLRQHLQHG